MNIQIYGEIRKLRQVFWFAFLVALLICFASPSMAGTPVGNEVFFYNTHNTTEGFSVVWQVDTASTCTVRVYSAIDGSGQLTPTINSITNGSTVLQNRGVMAVEVSGLSAGTTYFVQTESTDTSGTYVYPEFNSLLEVKTETVIQTPADWENGGLAFEVYDPDGIASENIIYDLIIIVDVDGASYPMQAVETNDGFYKVDFTPIKIRDASDISQNWNWNTDVNNHPLTIRIFGGLTFESGLGQKNINRTFLKDDVPYYPCFVAGGDDDINSCIGVYPEFINQTILRYDIPMEDTMELPSGWSIISLPVETADARISTLFPHARAVFGYTTKYELLGPDDILEVGKGYWINLPEPHTYTISGFAIRNYTFPNMPAGWSLIGGCSYPVQPGVQNGKIRAIFGFNGSYQLLDTDDYLERGKGYWINLSKSTTLNVPKKPVSFDMDLPSGWSFISLPVEPDDPTIVALFPDAIAVFEFTNRYELLGPTDTLEIGRGYWINLPGPHTYTLTGKRIESYTLTNMLPGSHVIGGCTEPAKVSVSNGTIQVFCSKYNQCPTGDLLEPGKGYLIYISERADITVEIE